MKKPLISLIIPTHHRSLLLRRALTSINEQSFRDEIEVIVVSDVIDRESHMVCHELLNNTDMYIRRNGTLGPSTSRNVGMKLASGKFVMFLDDDDAWCTNFMELLVVQLNSSTSTDFIHFDCMVIKESRPATGPIFISESHLSLKYNFSELIFVKNLIHMSTYLFPSHLLKETQFDTSMKAYEDWDFTLSIFEKKYPVHIPITCSKIYEVDDATTDRRGESENAQGHNGLLDYLYVYHRHPAPSPKIQKMRKDLINSSGLSFNNLLL